MPIQGVVALSVDTLVRTMRDCGLTRPHPVVLDEAMWFDDGEAEEVTAAQQDELRHAGLLGERGLAAGLPPLLRCLGDAAVEYYGWYHANGTTVGVVCAALGRVGVCAYRLGDTVHMHHVEPDRLAVELVDELPQVPPARMHAINLSVSDAGRALTGDVPRGTGGYLQRAGGTIAPDAQRLRQFLALPDTGGAELYVAARDRDGNRIRGRHSLGLIERDSTRAIRTIMPGGNGALWTVIAPAGPRDVVDRLHQMHSDIQR